MTSRELDKEIARLKAEKRASDIGDAIVFVIGLAMVAAVAGPFFLLSI